MNQPSTARVDRIGLGAAEAEIQECLMELMEACSQGDRERIESFYSPDVVVYDCPPKLRFNGRDEYMTSWDRWFLSQFNFPVQYERREESIQVNGDLAVVNSLMHFVGNFKNTGEDMSSWLRQTLVLRKISDEWRITHEHISVPVAEDGQALMDLSPEQDDAA